jgi:hypothetical protein
MKYVTQKGNSDGAIGEEAVTKGLHIPPWSCGLVDIWMIFVLYLARAL